MKILFSALSYIAAPIIYYFELSAFGKIISNTTSHSSYTMHLLLILILPTLLVLLGMYLAYRSDKTIESKWGGKILLFIGGIFLVIIIFAAFIGLSINGSEASLLSKIKIA